MDQTKQNGSCGQVRRPPTEAALCGYRLDRRINMPATQTFKRSVLGIETEATHRQHIHPAFRARRMVHPSFQARQHVSTPFIIEAGARSVSLSPITASGTGGDDTTYALS
jgi:hypothetical protein